MGTGGLCLNSELGLELVYQSATLRLAGKFLSLSLADIIVINTITAGVIMNLGLTSLLGVPEVRNCATLYDHPFKLLFEQI